MIITRKGSWGLEGACREAGRRGEGGRRAAARRGAQARLCELRAQGLARLGEVQRGAVPPQAPAPAPARALMPSVWDESAGVVM